MASLNEVKLIGYIGVDPEIKYSRANEPVTVIALATEDYPAKGQERGKTQWHRVTFFGKKAEILGKYAKKGSQALLQGRLSYSTYKGQDGKDVYRTDIIGTDFIFLGTGKKEENNNNGGV